MARCEICDKHQATGNKKEERGKAKYLGGNGRKTTGITKRVWKPNLQKIRVDENGKTVRKTVCVQCIRSGRVQKAIVRKLFSIPQG
jgi:large subunit ribosomal protein L28